MIVKTLCKTNSTLYAKNIVFGTYTKWNNTVIILSTNSSLLMTNTHNITHYRHIAYDLNIILQLLCLASLVGFQPFWYKQNNKMMMNIHLYPTATTYEFSKNKSCLLFNHHIKCEQQNTNLFHRQYIIQL